MRRAPMRQRIWKSQGGMSLHSGSARRFGPAEDFEMKDVIQDETC
jgi:hypothetical protein